MKELLGDPTYLYTTLQSKCRFFGRAETIGVLTSLAGGQPLPTLSSVLLEIVANSTPPSSTEDPTGPVSLLLVVEGDVPHS